MSSVSPAKWRMVLLRILSVINIIIGATSILVFLAMWVYVANVPEADDMMALLFGQNIPGALGTSLSYFCNILFLVMGVLGVRLKKKPQVARSLAIVSIVRIATSVLSFILLVASDSADFSSAGVSTGILLIINALVLWLAWGFAQHVDDADWAFEPRPGDPLADPKHQGFLRVLQVLFILNILFTLVGLIMTSRDSVVYSFDTLLDWANLVFESLALWFMLKRFRVTRNFVLAFTTFNVVVGATYAAYMGDFSIASQIFGSLFDILLFVYFLTSRRVKRTYTNRLVMKHADLTGEEHYIQRKGWPFIRNLIIYYCVFSLLGHYMEAGFCMFIRLGLVAGEYDPTNTMLWRDWFYPFPMEGAAVVIIALFLYPLKNWLVEKIKVPVVPYVISFIVNALVCGCIEFSMGLIVNSNLQLWNYSEMPFNIMGQVCLQNVLGFGVAASVIGWLVYPWLERVLYRIPRNAMNIAFVVIVAAYAIPQTLYLIDPPEDNPLQELSYEESTYDADEGEGSKAGEVIEVGESGDTGESGEGGEGGAAELNVTVKESAASA